MANRKGRPKAALFICQRAVKRCVNTGKNEEKVRILLDKLELVNYSFVNLSKYPSGSCTKNSLCSRLSPSTSYLLTVKGRYNGYSSKTNFSYIVSMSFTSIEKLIPRPKGYSNSAIFQPSSCISSNISCEPSKETKMNLSAFLSYSN